MSPSARKLCLGGSFNPIHYGHLRCSHAAAVARGFEVVVLIPGAQPPHKPSSAELASPSDRLAMTELAADSQNELQSDIRFEVNDIELKRSGPSYTIDTARELRNRGWGPVWWLIGADMLNYLPHWHLADQLVREVNFLVLARPGTELLWDTLPAHFQHLRQSVVTAPLIDVSSTEIRRRVRAGEDITQLTPPPVARYIEQHRLYR
jgi:nicotinate-nucleotide adenylyltransferase